MGKTIKGTCHLCGTYGELTFEHVPPKRAFNNRPLLLSSMEHWLERDAEGRPPRDRTKAPRGLGAYTLCGRCNNNTGSWYGAELVRWCEKGMYMLQRAPALARQVRLTVFGVYPLRFIKQAATMFFTLNPPPFNDIHEELTRFVLNRERTGIPEEYDFRLTLFRGPMARSSNVSGILKVDEGRSYIVTELAFPPWAYVLHLNEPPAGSLGRITHFAQSGYHDKTDVTVTIAIGEGHTPFPTDFRTREEVEQDRQRNELERRLLESRRQGRG